MEINILEKEIEAILFYKSEPVTIQELASLTETEEGVVQTVLDSLIKNLQERGVVVIQNNKEYSLTTSPSVSKVIERVVKDELNRDLSSASLETLSIITYKNPISRREIEYIRGVNSSFSLRALLIRGLIEKEVSRLDERVFLYRPSIDLLRYLGVSSLDQLPEWKEMQKEIHKIEKQDTVSLTESNQ